MTTFSILRASLAANCNFICERAMQHELLRHAMEIVRSEAAVRRLNLEVHLDATHHYIFVDAPRL